MAPLFCRKLVLAWCPERSHHLTLAASVLLRLEEAVNSNEQAKLGQAVRQWLSQPAEAAL